MLQIRRLSVVHYGIVLLGVFVLLLLWPGMLGNFLATQGYDPHGSCYLWQPDLVSLFVISDTLIGVAYVIISITLAYFVYRARRDIPFHWVFLAFGGFIIACGGTHFMDVLTVWLPAYWPSGYIRLITATASVSTAVVLPATLPRVFSLIDSAKVSDQRKAALEQKNRELAEEVAERRRIEADLRKRTDELQIALQRAEAADRAKTALLSTVSHEMRTPLSSIIGFSNLILTRKLAEDRLQQYATFIHEEGRRLATLINDFLDLQRLESGRQVFRFQTLNLADIVADVLRKHDAEDSPRHTIRLETAPVPNVYADAERIRQVVLNLLSNAIKYSPDGGDILLKVYSRTTEVVFAIADHGLGIPPDELPDVFERFHRGQAAERMRIQGTGLGLALCSEIIRAHKGVIWVESLGLNQGTTFSFALPAFHTPSEVLPDSEVLTL